MANFDNHTYDIRDMLAKKCPECNGDMRWDKTVEKWRCPNCGALYTWEIKRIDLDKGEADVVEHKWHEMGMPDQDKLKSLYTPMSGVVHYEL